jgi:hypothetical protein
MQTIYAGEDHVVDVPLPFDNINTNYSAIVGQVAYPTAATAAVVSPATAATPGGVLTKVGSAITAEIPTTGRSRVVRFTIPQSTTSLATIALNTPGELQIKLTRIAGHPEGAGISYLMFPLGQIVKPL